MCLCLTDAQKTPLKTKPVQLDVDSTGLFQLMTGIVYCKGLTLYSFDLLNIF